MTEKPKMLILCGLPASGKSSYAERWLVEQQGRGYRVNYDDLRVELYGQNWKFNRAEEAAMKEHAIEDARGAIENGCSVIVDNTNLNENARKPWINLAKRYGIDYEIFEIDTPVAECVARDAKRTGKARVGRAVIERMALFNGFIDFSDKQLYPRDFIIVDLDGTIADCDWRRKKALEGPTQHKPIKAYLESTNPVEVPCQLDGKVMDRQCPECGGKAKKNWPLFYERVEKDPPIWPVVELVSRMTEPMSHEGGYDVIVISGRPKDMTGKGTEEWLKQMPWPVRHLFLREGGDSRHDYIIKEEILELLPKERIKYVFEDRDQVVAMWRKHGLTTLQVADGSF
jgi:predicted kinase